MGASANRVNEVGKWIGAWAALALMWAGSAISAQELPYQATVVADGTVVRADIGEIYYVVAKLDAGTVVEVDDVISGWSKIIPPANCYSFVSKAFVNAKGDGKTGKVSADRVPVKAASIKGAPGESYHRQLYLFKGDTVEIVSENGSFYKIIPPKGVHVYLPSDSLKPVGTDETEPDAATDAATVVAQETKDETPVADPVQPEKVEAVEESQTAEREAAVDEPTAEAEQDADTAVTTAETAVTAAADSESPTVSVTEDSPAAADGEVKEVDTADTPSPQVAEADAAATGEGETVAEDPAAAEPVVVAMVDDAVVEVTDDEEGLPVREEVAAAEAVMVEAMAQPLEEQPLDELEAQYRQLQAIEDLNELERQMVDNRLIQIGRNRELLAAVALIRAPAAAEKQEQGYPKFDYRGILTGSTVYDGDLRTLLYRLVDEDSGRTLGYIRPGDRIDIYQAMGREIGIFGKSAIDIDTNVKMLVIESYEIIDSQK